MKNYQPRMKARCVVDLLCAFGTTVVFITAACGILCEQFIGILSCRLHLSIVFLPFKPPVNFSDVTFYFIAKM